MTTVFYNPACSKCRRLKEILEERREPYVLVEYLRTPPARDVLESIAAGLDGDASSLVRRDARFRELGLGDGDCATAAQVVELLLAHPDLLERPVVLRGGRTVVARPPELVLELLD
jgi:arsenate reductase (glutaredoxin)